MANRVKREIWVLAGLLTFSLAVALPQYRLGMELTDEGLLAYGALRVWLGEVANLDFVSLQPPFSFYALAAAFEFASPSLHVLRTLGLCLHIAIAVAAYTAARQITNPLGALIAALPLVVFALPIHRFVPMAVWWGTLWMLVSIVLLMNSVRTANRGRAVAAGFTTALCLASRHDHGLYLCCAVLAYFALIALAVRAADSEAPRLSPIRLLRLWSVGVALGALPLLGLWAATGALPEMVSQLIVFPLTTYAKTSSLPWPAFDAGAPLVANLETAFFYFPPAVIIASASWLALDRARERRNPQHPQIAFLLLLALLFYFQVFARSDIYHLVIALAPSCLLFGWGVELGLNALAQHGEAAGDPRRALWQRGLVLLGLALIFSGFLFQTRSRFLRSPPANARLLDLPRGGVYLPAAAAEGLERAVKFIQEGVASDRSILVLPYQPMYYFLSERRNPTRWNYIWPGDQTSEDHRAMLEQVRLDPPGVAVLSGPDRVERYAPELVRYVESEFRSVAQYRNATFYLPKLPKHDSEPSKSDLGDPLRPTPGRP